MKTESISRCISLALPTLLLIYAEAQAIEHNRTLIDSSPAVRSTTDPVEAQTRQTLTSSLPYVPPSRRNTSDRLISKQIALGHREFRKQAKLTSTRALANMDFVAPSATLLRHILSDSLLVYRGLDRPDAATSEMNGNTVESIHFCHNGTYIHHISAADRTRVPDIVERKLPHTSVVGYWETTAINKRVVIWLYSTDPYMQSTLRSTGYFPMILANYQANRLLIQAQESNVVFDIKRDRSCY